LGRSAWNANLYRPEAMNPSMKGHQAAIVRRKRTLLRGKERLARTGERKPRRAHGVSGWHIRTVPPELGLWTVMPGGIRTTQQKKEGKREIRGRTRKPTRLTEILGATKIATFQSPVARRLSPPICHGQTKGKGKMSRENRSGDENDKSRIMLYAVTL